MEDEILNYRRKTKLLSELSDSAPISSPISTRNPHLHQSKKKKAIVCAEEEEQEDRISALPDVILVDILSLVDTKSAVSTSFLSTKWNHLWTASLPNLHFDCHQFLRLYHSDTTKLQQQRFTAFVNKVLSLRNPSDVSTFSFSCDSSVKPRFLDKCLGYALHHNVQQLHLAVASFSKRFKFPRCFTDSDSLKVLTLKCDNCSVSEGHWLRLPALRTLHVEGFRRGYAGVFISRSVENSPNLETLVLKKCDGLGFLEIDAPQLRRLEFYHLSGCPAIEVSAPMLTSFRFEGDDFLPMFRAADFPCLEDVYVDLCPQAISKDKLKDWKGRRAMHMLKQLREAKSLTLTVETLKVLLGDPDFPGIQPLPFHQLKHLNFAKPRGGSPTNLPVNMVNYLKQGANTATPWL